MGDTGKNPGISGDTMILILRLAHRAEHRHRYHSPARIFSKAYLAFDRTSAFLSLESALYNA
jgi:hypothetical protein